MDEVNIRSSLLQNAIAGIIEKVVRQKTGYHPQIQFNDPIQIRYDGDKEKNPSAVYVSLQRYLQFVGYLEERMCYAFLAIGALCDSSVTERMLR